MLCPLIRDGPRRLLPVAIVSEHCSVADWREDLMGELARAGYCVKARNRSNLLAIRFQAGSAG